MLLCINIKLEDQILWSEWQQQQQAFGDFSLHLISSFVQF